MQEIGKRNNIQCLNKGEIIYSFAYLSAVWLLFWGNPIELIVNKYFLLNFDQIFTKQLIDKQS